MVHKKEIEIEALVPAMAQGIANSLQTLGKNLDANALEILAKKSEKKGMSGKVRKFKNLM